MIHFSSASMVVTTVRKAGYYPTSRTAAVLSKRFAYLFELEGNSTAVASIAGMLKGDASGWNWCSKHLTPSEYQVLYDFGAWWSCETDASQSDDGAQCPGEADFYEFDGDLNDHAFVLADLNRGRALTVLSHK